MDGLLLIDKSPGMTSHDVVARVRRLIRIRQIGHAGTLDPMATGLLVLCIGHAVRLSEYLIGKDKTYTGRMKLGERTSTDDADGEVIERREPNVEPGDLERVKATFVGDILQVPPQYSAIQVEGKRAYKLARQGETVELAPRPVTIRELELALVSQHEAFSAHPQMRAEWAGVASGGASIREVEMRVTCSAGTYIRSLARDIGEALGCGAHLVALRRVCSGAFTLAGAVTLDQLEQAVRDGDWARYLLPTDRAVEDMPRCDLDDDAAYRLQMGQFLTRELETVAGVDTSADMDGDGPGVLCRVYDGQGRFVALGVYDLAHTLLKPVKVFEQPKPGGR